LDGDSSSLVLSSYFFPKLFRQCTYVHMSVRCTLLENAQTLTISLFSVLS
jgi:hypothetical protein